MAFEAVQHQIDQAEQSAWSAWCANPAGEAPSPRAADREALAQRRALAAADLASAINGQKAVDARRAELYAESRHLQVLVMKTRLAHALAEARKRAKEVSDLAADLRVKWESLIGLSEAMREAYKSAVAAGDTALLSVIAETQTQFNTIEPPQLQWSGEGVKAAAQRWGEALQ
jgi:hypothetical protein